MGFYSISISFYCSIDIFLTQSKSHFVVGLVEVYPITLIFSFIFSIPTYLVLITVDFSSVKYKFSEKNIKWILILIILLGIIFTLFILYDYRDLEILFGYALSALTIGYIKKIE